MAYQDLYNQLAYAAPPPNPYALALRQQPMPMYQPPRPQQQQGGGNNMSSIASKIAKKYFSPSGSSAVGTAAGGGVTTLGGANMGVGGGISGASVTGGAAGAGLGGGVAGGATSGISGASVTGGAAGAGLGGGAGGGAAAGGMGAAAMGAGVVAMPFIAKELWGGGNPNIAKALRDFKTGKADQGPKGLQITEQGGVTFVEGDEGAVDQAWRQAMGEGMKTSLIRPGLLSIEEKPDTVRPVLASNSPGINTDLFGYLNG